jgi:hypothetical protein
MQNPRISEVGRVLDLPWSAVTSKIAVPVSLVKSDERHRGEYVEPSKEIIGVPHIANSVVKV